MLYFLKTKCNVNFFPYNGFNPLLIDYQTDYQKKNNFTKLQTGNVKDGIFCSEGSLQTEKETENNHNLFDI